MRKLKIAASIVFLSIAFSMYGMELTNSNTKVDHEFSNKLFKLDLFKGNFFELCDLERFVLGYEKSESVEPTQAVPIVAPLLEYKLKKQCQHFQHSNAWSSLSALDAEKSEEKKIWEKSLLAVLGSYKKSKENEVGIRKLQTYFKNRSLGELGWAFKHPDFPEETKNHIIEVVLKKQSFGSIDKNDYRQDTYNLLENIKSNTSHVELKKDIAIYLARKDIDGYDKEFTSKFIATMACLYKFDIESKKKIFFCLSRVVSDGNLNASNLLQEAVEYFAKEGFLDNYTFSDWVTEHYFQEYPFYTAKTLINLAIRMPLEQKRVALAIVKAYNLLEQTVDNNPEILCKDPESLQLFLQYGIKPSQQMVDDNPQMIFQDLKCLDLLLQYGIKPPDSFVLDAIEKGRVYYHLKIFDKHGVNLQNSDFMNKALATKNLACIHFMLNQQKNVLKQKPELCDFLVDLIYGSDTSISIAQDNPLRDYYNNYKKYNIAYAKSVYKAFLHALSSGNIT